MLPRNNTHSHLLSYAELQALSTSDLHRYAAVLYREACEKQEAQVTRRNAEGHCYSTIERVKLLKKIATLLQAAGEDLDLDSLPYVFRTDRAIEAQRVAEIFTKYFNQRGRNNIETAPSLHAVVGGEIVAEHTVAADATVRLFRTIKTILRAFPDESDEEIEGDVRQWDC